MAKTFWEFANDYAEDRQWKIGGFLVGLRNAWEEMAPPAPTERLYTAKEIIALIQSPEWDKEYMASEDDSYIKFLISKLDCMTPPAPIAAQTEKTGKLKYFINNIQVDAGTAETLRKDGYSVEVYHCACPDCPLLIAPAEQVDAARLPELLQTTAGMLVPVERYNKLIAIENSMPLIDKNYKSCLNHAADLNEELGKIAELVGINGSLFNRDDLIDAVKKLAASLKQETPDNSELDATDGAHPAWWRGHDHATKVFCQKVNEILDGKDDGSGVASEPWESTRRRLLKQETQPPSEYERETNRIRSMAWGVYQLLGCLYGIQGPARIMNFFWDVAHGGNLDLSSLFPITQEERAKYEWQPPTCEKCGKLIRKTEWISAMPGECACFPECPSCHRTVITSWEHHEDDCEKGNQ